jgi:hypothetical protein
LSQMIAAPTQNATVHCTLSVNMAILHATPHSFNGVKLPSTECNGEPAGRM